MKTRVLMTGAATLLGAEIIKELIQRPDVGAILLLMPSDEESQRRDFERLQSYLGPLGPSVIPVAGDLQLPRFGLSLAAWEKLATSFDLGFHCAQREAQDQNLELARQTNVRPVETWIQLLGCNSELRLHHLSTAFVGGTRRGLLTEFDLDCGQGFHNAWERSKFEAEVRLRECPASDRVNIYRPSHVLGRAQGGEAFELGGAYPLLATLAGAWVLPGDAKARLDLVPADYVAAAIVTLACSKASGTFHLAGGWENSISVRRAADLAVKARARTRSARLLPRGVAWPLSVAGSTTLGGLVSRGLAFKTARDLLHQGPVFDTYLADLALASFKITCPTPESWIEGTVRHAETRNWQAPPTGSLRPVAPLPNAATDVTLIRKDRTFQQKRFHRVGDVNVAYRDLGEGEPVVLLHGLAGAHGWDGVIDRMASHRRVLVVETLGLSDTEGPPSADFGLPAQAARVRGLLSALEIPSAHIVGNDTGGVIAQIFAVRWPNCVKGLVLSDCDAHGPWPPPHVAQIAALMGLPGGAGSFAALMRIPAVARSRFGFGRMVHDKRLLTAERVKQYLDPLTGNRDRRKRLKRFFRSLDGADLTIFNQLLGQLKAPTMIIWGADNACASPSWAKTLYDTIPGARRLELIPFAGLSCHEERPEHFARLLTEFFNEIGSENGNTSNLMNDVVARPNGSPISLPAEATVTSAIEMG